MGPILNVSIWKACLQAAQAKYLADSAEQKKHFAENPGAYVKYCKEIEDELNQRFKFILNGTPEAEEAKEVRLRIHKIPVRRLTGSSSP